MQDDIETNFRSLEALGVDRRSYSSIIVLALVEEIPDSIRLTMFRFWGDKLECEIQDLLTSFAKELDIRERHEPIFNAAYNNNHTYQQQRGDRPRQQNQNQTERVSTASALLVERSKPKKCQFCLEDHDVEDCKKHQKPEECKAILMKFSRCFAFSIRDIGLFNVELE